MRDYRTLRALRAGETVEVEGVPVKMDGTGEIKPGDSYVAERNTAPQLLIAMEISTKFGCVLPTSCAYIYDISECVKVCEA